MGEPSAFTREKLVVGVLLSRPEWRPGLTRRLTDRFGPIDFDSGPLEFTYTHYYDAEMGTPITRLFFAFARLLDPSLLSEIKQATNVIETELTENGGRKANLDPGFMSLSRLVLASTKEGSHRIPLRLGIYGEVTLLFERGRFRPLPWTYPDFRSEEYARILGRIRSVYKAQLDREAQVTGHRR